MGDLEDRGEGLRVRVVHHHGPGLGISILPQRPRIAGQSQSPRGARFHDPVRWYAVWRAALRARPSAR